MRLVLLCIILLILFSFTYGCTHVEPVVSASHTSALTRGEPFRPEVEEWNIDKLEVGGCVGRYHLTWELCLTHGYKWVENFAREESTSIDWRWYPLRKVR